MQKRRKTWSSSQHFSKTGGWRKVLNKSSSCWTSISTTRLSCSFWKMLVGSLASNLVSEDCSKCIEGDIWVLVTVTTWDVDEDLSCTLSVSSMTEHMLRIKKQICTLQREWTRKTRRKQSRASVLWFGKIDLISGYRSYEYYKRAIFHAKRY